MPIFLRLAALFLAVVLIPLTALLYFSLGNFMSPVSIGVISGADGPTAVFFTGYNAVGLIFLVTVTIFALGLLIIHFNNRRRMKALEDDQMGSAEISHTDEDNHET